MLNFDRNRFVTIQSGAVAFADTVRPLMAKALAEGVERLFFMGTGGVQILTFPAIELAQRLTTFPVRAHFPAQVVIDPPAGLDARSLVVIPSLSGTTKESVALLSFLKIGGCAPSPSPVMPIRLWRRRRARPTRTSPRTTPPPNPSICRHLLIVLALLAERGEYDRFDATVAELKTAPRAPGRREGRL